jgi:hypothetical protein
MLPADGTILHGGPVRVRPGLYGGKLAGAERRAAIVAYLLANPSGVTPAALALKLRMAGATVERALDSLQDECPALEERRIGGKWVVYLHLDEWRRTGWHAGNVVAPHGLASGGESAGYLPRYTPPATWGKLGRWAP